MFSSMVKLDIAVSNVALNICHVPKFKDEFLRSYNAHMSPARQILFGACKSAKVRLGTNANNINTFFYLVEIAAARNFDLDLRRYKTVSVDKKKALINWKNKPVAKPHKKIVMRELEEKMLDTAIADHISTVSVGYSMDLQKASKEALAFFSPPTKPTFDKVKPMSLEVTRPVLVGGIDILTASDEQLVHIIREAERQIKSDEDITKLSTKFKKKTEELKEVIKLCIQQLDNEAAIVDKK